MREGRFRITLPPGATDQPLRHADRRSLAGGRGRRAAGGARRLRGLPAPPPGPGAARGEAGNEFSARVFPIPPAATKELIVSYSQELTRASEPYRLPLRGLPQLGSAVDPRAGRQDARRAGGAPASSLGGAARRSARSSRSTKRDFRPDRDFEVAHTGAPRPPGPARREPGGGARRPGGRQRSPRPRSRRCWCWSTPAPRARSGSPTRSSAWEALVAELRKAGGGDDPMLTVAAFDQEVEPIFTGRGQRARRRRPAAPADRAARAGRVGSRARAALGRRRLRSARRAGARASCWSPTASPPRARPAPARCAQRVKALGGARRRAARRAGRRRHPRRRAAGPAGDGGPGARRRGARRGAAGGGAGAPADARHPLGHQGGDRRRRLGLAERGRRRAAGRRGAGLRRPAGRQAAARQGRRASRWRWPATLAPVERPLLERAWVKARIARLLDCTTATTTPRRAIRDMARRCSRSRRSSCRPSTACSAVHRRCWCSRPSRTTRASASTGARWPTS